MLSFTLALVAAAAAVASASILPVTNRVVEPDDAIGTFRGANFQEGCPSRISHSETVNDDGVIPHSVMTHNRNARCNDGGEMTVFLDAEEALAAVSAESSKDFIQDFADSGEPGIFGIERVGRTCGGTSFTGETVVILFTPTDTLQLSNSLAFQAGRRYMLVNDPNIPGACQYAAALRPDTAATPEPSDAPTETPGDGSGSGSREPPTDPDETPTETDDGSQGGAGAGSGSGSGGRPTRPRPGQGGSGSGGAGSGGDDPDATAEPTESPAASLEDVDGEGGDDGDDGDDDDRVCFPADAQVETEDGMKKISDLQIGDRVKVADGIYSDVFMFTHKDTDTVHDFVSLSTASGDKISATRGHYLYINGRFAAAMTAKVGDVLELGNGANTVVKRVSIEKKVGLFNPQTVHGDIIVNSIRASTFTRTVEPPTAQALLAPLRMMYDVLGISVSFLNNGADTVAALLPKGQSSL